MTNLIITHDHLMENAVSWLIIAFFLFIFRISKWWSIAVIVLAILWNLSWMDELYQTYQKNKKNNIL